MCHNIDPALENEIVETAKLYGIDKIILFGSRARGDNRERSDIDLAVSGKNVADFYDDIEENTHTLLMFDVVALDGKLSDELRKEIEKDGVVLYEKV
ncbi:MAG: nucleotidyltransferase domain-containing protein [Synergistes sp.]|nr:nucleotidyltransferase domain-containing protein [Synergistes sp.]